MVFADKLTDYKVAKGAIQFPLDKPIPYEIIGEITRWRVSCVESKNKLNEKVYEYKAVIQPADDDKDTAYIVFPYDIKTEFGKGRVKVYATFDGEPYDGSIVNMGVKNEDASVCYIIGIRKDIRAKIGKQVGDTVEVTIRERG
jgi:hypothetical protein